MANEHLSLVILFRGNAAQSALQLLEEGQEGPVTAKLLAPPVRGKQFFAASGTEASVLDRWWGKEVDLEDQVWILTMHEPGLDKWLVALKAKLVVGVPTEDVLSLYRNNPLVTAILTEDFRQVTESVMQILSLESPAPYSPHWEGYSGWHLPVSQPKAKLPVSPVKKEGSTKDPSVDEAMAMLNKVVADTAPPARPIPPPVTASDSLDQLPGVMEALNQISSSAPASQATGRRESSGFRPPEDPRRHPPEDDDEWTNSAREVHAAEMPFGGPRPATAPTGVHPSEDLLLEVDGEQAHIMRPWDLLASARHVNAEASSVKQVPIAPSSPSKSDRPKDKGQPKTTLEPIEIDTGTTTRGHSEVSGRSTGLFKGFVNEIKNRVGRRVLEPPEEVTTIIASKRPITVAVGSLKGGVGKTTMAAALAAIAGEALSAPGGGGANAIILDFNVNNPNQWGQLQVAETAHTVRDCMTALMRGQSIPPPTYALTPALAIYPESRQAGETYEPPMIKRFMLTLKNRYAFIVIDLANHVPSFTDDIGTVVATCVQEADVMVVPTTFDPSALEDCIAYLSTESMRNKPVVVPYIASKGINEKNPELQAMLERLRGMNAILVRIPDDPNALRVLWDKEPITRASPGLREAYINLILGVIHAIPLRRRSE